MNAVRDSTLAWEGKRFVKDRVTSFFHIPLNFGAVMKRNMKAIEVFAASRKNTLLPILPPQRLPAPPNCFLSTE